jgi:hypothetical protein
VKSALDLLALLLPKVRLAQYHIHALPTKVLKHPNHRSHVLRSMIKVSAATALLTW